MPSAPAIAAANLETTDEVWLALIKIEHPAIAQPIRVVNNTQEITSNGELYLAGAFIISPPDDSAGVPSCSIEIDNVDRAIVDAARAINTPATVTLSIILASSPNVIEGGPWSMSLIEVSYDPKKVTGTLAYEDFLNEQYPSRTFNPARYPGLF
jgi:hypothetical protein